MVLAESLYSPRISEGLLAFTEMKDNKWLPCIERALWPRCGSEHLASHYDYLGTYVIVLHLKDQETESPRKLSKPPNFQDIPKLLNLGFN